MNVKNNHSPSGKHLRPIVATVVVIAIIGGYAVFGRKQLAPTNQAQNALNLTTQARPEDITATTPYRDGHYQAIGTYRSPGGDESINVSLALKGGAVIDAIVTSNATLPNSIEFQGMFIENYKSQVIGKSIAELNLTKVSGSSLTPKGFNDAVEKIKAQAQAER